MVGRGRLNDKKSDEKLNEPVYLYCVLLGSHDQGFGRIGIGGRGDEVHTIPHKDITAVVSRINTPNVPRTDENILAHQRVVQKAFDVAPMFPVQFPTVLEDEEAVRLYLSERYLELHAALDSLKDAAPAAPSDPTRAVLEDALDHSLSNAFRIRELTDAVAGEPPSPELVEISLRNELDRIQDLHKRTAPVAELVEVALRRTERDLHK